MSELAAHYNDNDNNNTTPITISTLLLHTTCSSHSAFLASFYTARGKIECIAIFQFWKCRQHRLLLLSTALPSLSI